MLKIVTVAPIAIDSVMRTTAVKLGLRNSNRAACRVSRLKSSSNEAVIVVLISGTMPQTGPEREALDATT
jgi:hypothetical protein